MHFLLVQTIFSYHKGSIFSLKQPHRVLEGPGKHFSKNVTLRYWRFSCSVKKRHEFINIVL